MWNKVKDNWPLLFLIAIHASILFYDYSQIPFYHDELSAIERCKFNDFNDLIRKGVMVDGHPAGVHLLIYTLIKFFGISEWVLKLPFLLAGIGSLIFIFKISEFIFNRYAAIVTCIFFIFLSYYLTQIIVARPYSPGLFFTLGTFYHGLLTKLFPHKKFHYFMFALFSVGAMYSHYFSFLQCVTIWFVIFAFNAKRMNKGYFITAILASILCFMPHAIVTYHQLKMGGLGWLGKPDLSFFANFFYTFFNSSIPLMVVAAGLLIFSFMVKSPRKRAKETILLALLILPCLVLFTYSVMVAPVMQPPALFFCTPFLLIFIGNGISIFHRNFQPVFIILFLVFNAFLLIIENQYYKLRDYQPIEKFVLSSKNIIGKRPSSNILIIWAGNSKYINYYIRKHNFNHKISVTDTLKDIKRLNLSKYDMVVCNQLAPPVFYELNKTFPFIESVDNNLLFSFITLSKKEPGQPLYSKPVKLLFEFDSGKEWSQSSYSFKIDKMVNDKFSFFEFIPNIDSAIKGAELVLETYDGEERIDWRSIYLEPGNILSMKLKDVIRQLSPNQSIKIYIWNSEKVRSKPIEILMLLRHDNPWEYEFKVTD